MRWVVNCDNIEVRVRSIYAFEKKGQYMQVCVGSEI